MLMEIHMRKYDHKKGFPSRRMKESQDWTYIEDGNDLRELGVYDQLDMEYGKRIANMFLD